MFSGRITSSPDNQIGGAGGTGSGSQPAQLSASTFAAGDFEKRIEQALTWLADASLPSSDARRVSY